MQLVEVKGNSGKVKYSTEVHTLFPADFLLIDDASQRIIAQINSIEITNEPNINVANLRFVLSIDKEDNISLYRGVIPSRKSQVYYIIPDEIMELIKGNDNGIYFGELANHPACYVKPSINILDKNLYVISDREDKTSSIIENIAFEAKKEEKKVIIIDFDGKYKNLEDASFLKVSDEIKLPLNIDAFNNIIERDTSDCPLGDKALIQSIVIEVIDYLKSIDDKFLPFSTFKNIIDDEFLQNPTSGLMAFRNKLQLYFQNGIFAENADYNCVINNTLNNSSLVVVDLSKIKENWYNFAVKTVFDIVGESCYIILSLENLDVDRKYIAELYNKDSIIPVISTSHNSKYSAQLKSICPNYIIGKPSNIVNTNEVYSEFLNGINQNQVILYGDSTLNLVIVTELKTINEIIEDKLTANEIKRDVDKLLSSSKTLIPKEKATESQPDGWSIEDSQAENEVLDSDLDFLDEFLTEPEQPEEIEQPENTEQWEEQDEIVEDESSEEETTEASEQEITEVSEQEDILKEEKKDELDFELEFQEYDDEKEQYEFFSAQDESTSEPPYIDLEEDQSIDLNEASDNIDSNTTPPDTSADKELPTLEENVLNELNDSGSNEKSIDDNAPIEQSEEEPPAEIENVAEEQEPQAKEDAEEVVVASNEQEFDDEEEDEEVSKEAFLNEFGDADTTKNIESAKANEDKKQDSETQAKNETEPPKVNENINTKNDKEIPIYGTKEYYDLGIEDLPFTTGDTVFHPKHGVGVVEGFTNYSNKILFCQINFENVGRRILDPRIAGLEKMDE